MQLHLLRRRKPAKASPKTGTEGLAECCSPMSNINSRIAKVDSEIAVAKETKQKHKMQAETEKALVKSMGLGIDASEAQRDVLIAERKTEQKAEQ